MRAPSFTRSLKGRLAIYFALSISASLLISGFVAVALVQRYLHQRTVSDLKFQAETLSQQIENEGLPQKRYIADLERTYATRALIIPYQDQAIQNLPQPSGAPSDLAQLSRRPLSFIDWDLLKRGGTQVRQTRLPDQDRETVVVIHGINAGGQLAGALLLAKPVDLLQSWKPLAGFFLIAGVASLAISLLISFMLARRLSRPLHELTEAATAVAAGDFSSEVTVRSEDEIGRLADAFRFMTDEVQKAQEQQRQFVINVSHELKTPLTAIAGHTQALREGVAEDPAAVAASLKVIDAETRRLSRLIEDLLSLAKFDVHQFGLRSTSVSAGELAQAVADSLSHQAHEQGVSLTAGSAGAPGELKLNTDPDRLRQILANLTQNALAHTTAGDRISLTTSARDGRIDIEVADTGRGIPAGELPHVFDRFYRGQAGARPGQAGLGLGLSISRELARALGGDITVDSRPGHGSRFTVSLPREATSPGASPRG